MREFTSSMSAPPTAVVTSPPAFSIVATGRIPNLPRNGWESSLQVETFMRSAFCLVVVAAFVGCEQGAPVTGPAPAPGKATAAERPPANNDPSFVPAPDTLPPDLGTRIAGEDWPAFLGPRGDSTSIERGIHTAWNDKPPRIV